METRICNYTLLHQIIVKIRPLMDGNTKENKTTPTKENVKIRPLMDGNDF